MLPLTLPDPPTQEALHSAQTHLQATLDAAHALENQIRDKERSLAQLIHDAQAAITRLSDEKKSLDAEAARTRAYLSPVRRLPAELLREIFLWNFEEHAACAWVLSAVSSSWRRLAIRTPRLWSKIRLITTPTSSPELIRLWLERSGHTVSLDIEIYLRVTDQCLNTTAGLLNANQRRRRRPSGNLNIGPSSWPSMANVGAAPAPPHTTSPNSPLPYLAGNAAVTGSLLVSGPPLFSQDSGVSSTTVNRPSIHWAHIAFYYLVEQMPRWERFIFRYDKAFKSMTALASIAGEAPLLREFEISSSESSCAASDWAWLPNTQSPFSLPSLTALTLQFVPFKWSSPLFSSSLLRHLNLRAPINPALPLDRVRYIVSQCTENLESLSLYFTGVLSNVLPLTPLRLDGVRTLRVGGHWLMSQLVDCLVLPQLRSLSLLVDPREPSEDVISGLLTRSAAVLGSDSAYSVSGPGHVPVIPLEELSLGFDTPPWNTTPTLGSISPLTQIPTHLPHTHTHPHPHPHPHSTFIPYYLPSPLGLITSTTSWRTLLSQLPYLRVLKVGGMQIESLLISLGTFDDDTTGNNHNGSGGNGAGGGGNSGWLVPRLEVLKMRVGCNGPGQGVFSSDVVSRLVVVVEARNPEAGSHSHFPPPPAPPPHLIPSGSNSTPFINGWHHWGPGAGAATMAGGNNHGWGSSVTTAMAGGNSSTSISNVAASTSAGSAGVKRLKSLEVQDCELGVDIENWLGRRVERVVFVDPLFTACDRTARRRRFF